MSRAPPSLHVSLVSRKGSMPSFSSSMVNLMVGHTSLRWWSKGSTSTLRIMQHVSSTYRSIHTYKAPAFLHLASFMPWGWLEHLVETSASCTPNIKLSAKNLRCFYTATATEKGCHFIIIVDLYFKGSLKHFHTQKTSKAVNHSHLPTNPLN